MVRRFPVLIVLALVGLMSAPASAQTISTEDVVAQLDENGWYSDFGTEGGVASAIDRANSQGTAFAWLDTDDGGEGIAQDLMQALDDQNSRYKTVLVLTNVGVWAQSNQVDPGPAASAALEDFSRGAVTDGLNTFNDTLSGEATSQGGTSSTESGDSSSGGGGLPAWLLAVVVAGAGLLGLRFWSGKRKTKKAEVELLEVDRLEIKEQLRDNADRVIDLGDKVIASKDQDLIRTYELASKAYTDVSTEIDNVSTIVEMDRLDDRIDHAEWQFEVIEAKLEGRTPPTLPSPDSNDVRPGPTTPVATRGDKPDDKPALGPNESVFRQRRTSRSRRRSRTRNTGMGGGFGGMGGGGLGGILGSIILGGGMGRPRTSRRSQRRRASTGSYGGGFGDIGGFGGGGSFGGQSRGGGGRF